MKHDTLALNVAFFVTAILWMFGLILIMDYNLLYVLAAPYLILCLVTEILIAKVLYKYKFVLRGKNE